MVFPAPGFPRQSNVELPLLATQSRNWLESSTYRNVSGCLDLMNWAC